MLQPCFQARHLSLTVAGPNLLCPMGGVGVSIQTEVLAARMASSHSSIFALIFLLEKVGTWLGVMVLRMFSSRELSPTLQTLVPGIWPICAVWGWGRGGVSALCCCCTQGCFVLLLHTRHARAAWTSVAFAAYARLV